MDKPWYMVVYEANLIRIAPVLNGYEAHNSKALQEHQSLNPDGNATPRGDISYIPLAPCESVLSFLLPALFITSNSVVDNLYYLFLDFPQCIYLCFSQQHLYLNHCSFQNNSILLSAFILICNYTQKSLFALPASLSPQLKAVSVPTS